MKNLLSDIKIISLILLLSSLLTACGGGNSKGSSDNENNEAGQTGKLSELNNLNGYLMVRQDGTFPTIGFRLTNATISKISTVVNGREAKAHPNGRIVFVQKAGAGCPENETRLSIKETNGQITPVTACSKNLDGFSSDNYKFYSPEISPDNTKISVALTHSFYFSNLSVAVFDMQGTLIALHQGYAFPTWHPNGYLLMAGQEAKTGIYKTNTALQNVTRIDNNKLTSNVASLDIDNETGQTIVFGYNADIWTIDIDNPNPKRLPINSTKEKLGAIWSPNAEHIAFVHNDGRKIYFYEVATKRTRFIESDEIFDSFSSSPLVPLSWIK